MSDATLPLAAPFELPCPALGRWREGNTGTEGVWQFHGAEPGRAVLVTALVHGNELCGAWALLAALEAGLRPRCGTLTLAFCNLAAFDRFDAAAPDASRFVDEDFNRVWGPGLATRMAGEAATTERRRARALLPFVEQADWLLDLHSMHEPGEPLLLTGLGRRHIRLAHALQAPRCVISDAGHREGLRLRDHGRFGAMTDGDNRALLLECGYHGALSSRTVALDMLARFLAASGALALQDIPPDWWQPRPAAPQQLLAVTHAVAARSLDVRFAQDWHGGQCIAQAGTVIGWDAGEPFTTPYDHCTLVMPSLRQLRAGVTVVRLARAVPMG
ncbi:succinylglutamate desuccinylase/aspartoacylase family protein [Aquabacterium sp.]|uniref:succinylglutamate desuccinylase/aspartoacylase domain-containing protein n=1 Tax=Aquabacterium sp. TaxID=1872578 RepID=UPI003784B58B